MNEILALIEEAKKNGKDEITIEGEIDDIILNQLLEDSKFCVLYSADSWLDKVGLKTIISWSEDALSMTKWSESLSDTWHYQVIHHTDSLWPYYGLHEVHMHKDGSLASWTANPIVVGENVKEIKKSLKMMLSDVEDRVVLKINKTKENNE